MKQTKIFTIIITTIADLKRFTTLENDLIKHEVKKDYFERIVKMLHVQTSIEPVKVYLNDWRYGNGIEWNWISSESQGVELNISADYLEIQLRINGVVNSPLQREIFKIKNDLGL